MLADRGYRVMAASRGQDALDTFVFHHSQIALVLANALLPDYRNGQLCEAMRRIDPHVPVISARHPPHRLDGADTNRANAFAGLMAEVDGRVFPAHDPRSSQSHARAGGGRRSADERRASDDRHDVLTWPLCDEELDEIEGIEDRTEWATEWRRVWRDRGELLQPVTASDDGLKIEHTDYRNYLAAESSARRIRRRRIGGVAAVIVLLGSVAIAMLMDVGPTTARANEPDDRSTAAPAAAPAAVTAPAAAAEPAGTPARSNWPATSRLNSIPATDFVGIDRLISAERAKSSAEQASQVRTR